MSATWDIGFDPGDIVLHHKSGNYYRIICFAAVEATLEKVVVYMEVSSRGVEFPNSKIWTRPINEFNDGRFQWIM